MPPNSLRDVIEELAVRGLTRAMLAKEANVELERVDYWVAIAELRRAQAEEVSSAGASCSS